VLFGGRVLVVGLAMAVAVASIDVLYAALGLAGAGRPTGVENVRLVLGLTSAAILIMLGARTMWTGFLARTGLEAPEDVVSPRRAFATAVAATALNPLTIALWTISFPATVPSAAEGALGDAAVLLLGVSLGTLAWYSGFALAVALTRGHIGARLLAAIDIGTGGGLVVFGALLGHRAVEER
jgi:threonine/homoserine/homoserine lactone efflux protein